VTQKNSSYNRFGELSISRLASFRPKPGNDTIPVSTKMSHLWCYFQLFNIHNSIFVIHHSLFDNSTFHRSTIRQLHNSTFHHSTFIILNFRKSTALPQIKSSVANYVAMWFKKNHDTRFGEPSISRLAPIRPKPGNDTIPVSTKMSHLWCYFQLFCILHSTFIIRNSSFDISTFHQFDSSTFDISTFHHSTVRQFDIHHFDVSTFIISTFRHSSSF